MSNPFLTKKDPLLEAVRVAMQDGEMRRQAEALVNEEFGVYSRKAVVREQLAAYDARLEEAYKCMKEGEKEPKLDMKAREKAKSDYSKMREKMVGKGKDAETTRKIVGEAKKLADKDYDKDGKVESPKDEVWGSRFRAAKMAGKMEEKKMYEAEVDYSAPDRAAVTRDNKPSTPAQTNAATSGPSAADKAALTSKIKSMNEAAYSAKAARAGKDIGKPGKMFSKIASKAGEKYGSEERGKKVAGAILKRIRAKHMKEDSSFNTALQELVSYSKMTASGVSKPVTKAQDYSQTDEAPAPTETKPVVGSSSRPNAAQAMSKLDAMPKPKAPASAVAGRTKYVGSQNIRPAAPAQAAPAQTSSARPKVNAPLPPVKPAEIKGSVTSAPRTSTVPSSGGSTSTTGPTPVGGANIGPNAGRTTAPKPAASTPVAKPAATTSTDTYSGGRNKAAFDAAFNKARELGGSTARFTFDNKQYQAAKTKDEYVSSKAQKDVNIGDLSKNVAPTATPASITPTSSSGGSSNPPGASTGDVTPKGTSDAMRDPEYGRQKKETGSSQQTFAESFVSVGTNKYRIV